MYIVTTAQGSGAACCLHESRNDAAAPWKGGLHARRQADFPLHGLDRVHGMTEQSPGAKD